MAELYRLLFAHIESGDRRRLVGMLQGGVTSLGNRIVGALVAF